MDRIYTTKEAVKASYDWKFAQTSVPTDHWMVSVKYAPAHAPYIGKGCWTMQIPELKNNDLMQRIIKRGLVLQMDMKSQEGNQPQREALNPQSLWADFKNDIVKMTRKHCSESRAKLTKKITAIERELKDISRNPNIDTNNNIRANEAYLTKELAILKHIHERDKKDDLRAVISNHGEVLGGVWSGMNKDRKLRDILN